MNGVDDDIPVGGGRRRLPANCIRTVKRRIIRNTMKYSHKGTHDLNYEDFALLSPCAFSLAARASLLDTDLISFFVKSYLLL